MRDQRTDITLKKLLEEISEKSPCTFQEGQYYEVLQSIYPTYSTPKEVKNILVEETLLTKPLASNKKDKQKMNKMDSPLKNFYNSYEKGDLLKVDRIEDGKAFCINLSIKESYREKYYDDEYSRHLILEQGDVFNMKVKRIFRGIKKYI